MPSKRKKTHDLKLAADPLGRSSFTPPYTHPVISIYLFLFVLDDILRKNLFLSKYARSADQLKQLGKCRKTPPVILVFFTIDFFLQCKK